MEENECAEGDTFRKLLRPTPTELLELRNKWYNDYIIKYNTTIGWFEELECMLEKQGCTFADYISSVRDVINKT